MRRRERAGLITPRVWGTPVSKCVWRSVCYDWFAVKESGTSISCPGTTVRMRQGFYWRYHVRLWACRHDSQKSNSGKMEDVWESHGGVAGWPVMSVISPGSLRRQIESIHLCSVQRFTLCNESKLGEKHITSNNWVKQRNHMESREIQESTGDCWRTKQAEVLTENNKVRMTVTTCRVHHVASWPPKLCYFTTRKRHKQQQHRVLWNNLCAKMSTRIHTCLNNI